MAHGLWRCSGSFEALENTEWTLAIMKSATAFAKEIGIPTKQIFEKLVNLGYVKKTDSEWKLTQTGIKSGGEYRESKKFGQFIVWPSNLDLSGTKSAIKTSVSANTKSITSTAIGKHFGMSANKINFILSELGWLKKDVKGWLATQSGKRQGAIQAEDKHSGVPYVRWPEDVLQSNTLVRTMKNLTGEELESVPDALSKEHANGTDFRQKFEAKFRSTDGHFVRSKAEMLIDNYFYMAEIVHAYERKLPIEENVYCDFYLPGKKVYIEYWGYDNDSKYATRKIKKQEIYKKYGFSLIELEDKDVQNLDDILPRMLLKFGITAY